MKRNNVFVLKMDSRESRFCLSPTFPQTCSAGSTPVLACLLGIFHPEHLSFPFELAASTISSHFD